MKYKELLDFIENKMKMSHIYQPVMIKTLLKSNGSATIEKIAKELLSYDLAQIDYYIGVTKNMVGKVLKSRGVVSREGEEFFLEGYSSLSNDQIEELKVACTKRLNQYLEKRGEKIWAHRRMGGVVPGSLRYEVLKRAKGRCELCGISKEEKALDVDHILPASKGGSDEISNFQALCFTCNRNKRNTDDTDFRNLSESYKKREKGCLFCELPESRIINEDDLSLVIHDKYPVTEGHTLIIPKRHILSYFDLGSAEINSINRLLQEEQKKLREKDSSILGFNIGVNVEEAAGMTIFHCHIHLIPRRKGDVDEPRGGIRNVIPGMGCY